MFSKFFASKSFNLPLYTLCAGIVAITALAAGLTYWMLEHNQRVWSYEYGQALANLSAHRALDSTLNHDLVSLQVILSDVAENSSVVNATIHDVENNLLVQAGRRNPTGPNPGYGNFSAPITLHNSIAGYVTITLDLNGPSPFIGQLMWLFALLAAVLISLTLCYGYFNRASILGEKKSRGTIPIIKTSGLNLRPSAEENPDELEDQNDSVAGKFPVHIMLCLQNYNELSRQLNNKVFRNVNQRLEQQLLGILSLYGGNVIHASQQIIHLQFNSTESSKDAVFNGLCSALLLLKLNQLPTAVPLQITALIHNAEENQALLKRLPYHFTEQDDYQQLLCQAPENTLIVQAHLLEDSDLAQRFAIEPLTEGDDLVQIVSVEQPYQDLLDKQCQQLSKV